MNKFIPGICSGTHLSNHGDAEAVGWGGVTPVYTAAGQKEKLGNKILLEVQKKGPLAQEGSTFRERAAAAAAPFSTRGAALGAEMGTQRHLVHCSHGHLR